MNPLVNDYHNGIPSSSVSSVSSNNNSNRKNRSSSYKNRFMKPNNSSSHRKRGRDSFEDNCPYKHWSIYFPNEIYLKDSELDTKIKHFIIYFENAFPDIVESSFSMNDHELIEKQSINVDYTHLKSHTSIENIQEYITEEAEKFFSSLGLALSHVLDTKKNHPQSTKKFVRLTHFDKITSVKNLKSNLMNKFVCIKGTIVRTSVVKPIVNSMGFLCTSCHEVGMVHFQDGKFKTPKSCSTQGCKGRNFIPQRSNEDMTCTVDWQRIRLQDKLLDEGNDDGRIPRTIECEVTNDLVDLVTPGDVVFISGTVKLLASEEGKRNKNAHMYLVYIDVNSLVKASSGPVDEANENDGFTKDFVQFSTRELYFIREIHSLGNGEIFRLLVNSLCTLIFGHELVKAGLLLALFGGRRRAGFGDKHISIRTDPHVLVVGDPGLGKSQMLNSCVKVAPRGVYVCGNTATTSGLTVTVCKDNETGDTALEAGALVLADQGICCIDEFDKMTEHQALLEAMEQQSISIAKAGMVCNLPARSTVLAAANPVGGHYNKAKTVSENLKLSAALLSRFDLVFILLDKPDVEKDKHLSEHIMRMHTKNGKKNGRHETFRFPQKKSTPNHLMDEDSEEKTLEERLTLKEGETMDFISPILLKKYISYARTYVHPKLSPEAAEILQTFYLKLRREYRTMDAIPITTRQLESLIRLSEARARTELRETVTAQDAKDVIEIMKYSLWETYQDDFGYVHFERSQNGAGMSRKYGDPKKFVALLTRISHQTANNRFTFDQLYKIAQDAHMECKYLQDLVDTLNNQGYLLKKGPRVYQLATSF